MIVSGAEFAATLESRGFDLFSGVPCSLIEGLIATLEVHPRLPYVDADEITEAMRRALGGDGPHFILAKVTAGEAEAPRTPHTPHQLRDRFRASAGAH